MKEDALKNEDDSFISMTTNDYYDVIVEQCLDIFSKKMKDYGSSWRILRPSSLTDQIFIKAQRIRTIQDTGENRVGDGIVPEFRAIINYSIMAMIQLEKGATTENHKMDIDTAMVLYEKHVAYTKELMMAKNHDYGEAWKDMRVSSLTDLILTKLLRIKQIENNEGETWVSEGVEGNYHDIINYSIFALIKLTLTKQN